MKINLPLYFRNDGGYADVVEAELLPEIAPHLAHVATFAVHLGGKPDVLYRHWWFVSNVESGSQIAYNPSKAIAIRHAEERLATKTPKDVMRVYRKARANGACDD